MSFSNGCGEGCSLKQTVNQKKRALEELITDFLKDESTFPALRDFSFETIDAFITDPNLPPHEDFENVFWAAIWTAQHLADEEHVSEGVTAASMKPLLEYLQGKATPPPDLQGLRPLDAETRMSDKVTRKF